jgi:hypothetical protein
MRRAFSAAGVLTSTLLFLALFAHFNPFGMVCDAMDKLFGAPPKWTQVTNYYLNPKTQEITHGDDPMPGLGILKQYWHEHGGAGRTIFMGNSQMHSITLASGELPMNTPDKTYVDLVMDQIRSQNPNELLYRLSYSGLSYPEALWQINYMLSDSDLRPQTVVLQMNYQAFWTGGIRDSMLPMLSRPSFRAQIETLAASNRPDAPTYVGALQRYDQLAAKNKSAAHATTNPGDTGLATIFSNSDFTPGYAIETRTRGWIDQAWSRESRDELKESFENVLYRGRLYLLRVKPSTARSISGYRLMASSSALDSVAALCKENNIKLILFYAPVNPTVSLYRTPENRKSFREIVEGVAAKHGVALFDFENSISAEHWGRMLSGPDPLHMGRSAQQQMAKQIVEAIESVEAKN